MISLEVETYFRLDVDKAGHTLDALTPAEGIDLMVHYYRDVRVQGCALEADGDMLLFQWGTYNWGEGEHFEVGITRQLTETEEEDGEMRQLSLTFRYET